MNTRIMGRLPDTEQRRRQWARTRACMLVKAGLQDDSTIVQPSSYMLDQKSLPSCVGKSYQGRLNALLGIDPSGVNLWIESRALDGSLLDSNVGTTAQSAVDILLDNGWSTRTNVNEDDVDPTDVALTVLPDLSAMLEAGDQRIATATNHQVFVGTDDEVHYAILAALREKDSNEKFVNALTFGTGVNGSFFDPPSDVVLDTRYLDQGGAYGGHQQGLVGWVKERSAYLIQGSWADWTYCVVNGKKLYGHCLVSRAVIEHAWDVDKVRVV